MASLGVLTAGIAHEIRNPLNFVVNFAQLAAEQAAEVGELLAGQAGGFDSALRANAEDLLGQVVGNVNKIREHGQRANDIVNAMLQHARGQSGERRATDLNALVGEYVTLAFHGLRGQDATFNVSLQTDFDPSVPPVEVYPQDIARVILNLAHNAFYAANQRRRQTPGFAARVEVRTCNLPSVVEIRLRDNGEGIPAAMMDRLFTPFFTTKPAGAGTGLGLSISHDIVVHMHKGDLRAESEEGRFAEFIVTLPKARGVGE
jgi:signal transduction histidine kinase